jgi:hypothetical protein
MSSIALKWEFWFNGRARSKTIRITLSRGLANDALLSSDRGEAKRLNKGGHAPVLAEQSRSTTLP